MYETTSGTKGQGGRHDRNWHAEKPFLTRPAIMGTKVIDGVKYYRGKWGKIYDIELFDKMFTVVPGKVRPKNAKQKSVDGRHINDED